VNDSGIGTALGALAEQAVPDGDLDLQPAVAARLARRGAARRRRRTRAVVLVGALLVAALTPLVVAAARPAVEVWLHHSGLVLVPRETVARGPTPGEEPPVAASTAVAGAAPVGTVVVGRVAASTVVAGTAIAGPGPAGSGGVRRFAGLPLDEVQRRASFPVCAPTWLPDGLQVVGGDVGPNGSVAVRFAPASGAASGGGIQQIPGTPGGHYAAPAEHAEAVAVRGRPATFVRGTWEKDGRWHPEADAGLLSWEANGVTYVLMFSGLDLNREQVIRIAESCTTG
jgi:hypothetical protein